MNDPREYVDAELVRQALEAALDALTAPALHAIDLTKAIIIVREALMEFETSGR
jgi:hypothetical protein